MKKTLFLIISIALTTTIYAQKDHFGRIKAGVEIGGIVGLKDAYIENRISYDKYISKESVQINDHNGLGLGGYCSYQKRAMIINVSLQYSPTLKSVRIEHPQSTDFEYQNTSLLHSFKQDYTMGFLIGRQYPRHAEIGFGYYHIRDFNHKNKRIIEYDYQYDATLGENNNMPMYAYIENYKFKPRQGILLYIKYNNNKSQYPWYIKAALYGQVYTEYNEYGLVYFDSNHNRKPIYKYTGTTSKGQLMLTFGMELFNSRKQLIDNNIN